MSLQKDYDKPFDQTKRVQRFAKKSMMMLAEKKKSSTDGSCGRVANNLSQPKLITLMKDLL